MDRMRGKAEERKGKGRRKERGGKGGREDIGKENLKRKREVLKNTKLGGGRKGKM